MGKAPDAPDPYATADAQWQLTQKAADQQKKLAMDAQDTPTGSVRFVADPSSPSGYRAIQELSPEEQTLLGLNQDLTANYGGLAGEQLGRVSDTMSTPFSFDAARAKVLTDMNKQFLDPQWASREDALKNDLMNRGIREGDTNWVNSMRDFEGSRSKAYDSMFLDAYDKANNAALTERNIPITDLNSLGIGAFPMDGNAPSYLKTNAPEVSAPNIADMIYKQYAADSARAGAGKGALGNIAGMALGGWASSDRRVKTEVTKVGDDPRGWGVYRFKYILDAVKGKAAWQLGFMADEVEKVRPGAVYMHPESGMKMVNYETLAQ